MSQIKGSNTKPEILVRKFLLSSGLRYKLHDKNLLSKTSIVLLKSESVVFVNGCFWHGHKGCRKFVVPKTRTDFWLNKINTNKANAENIFLQSIFSTTQEEFQNIFPLLLKKLKHPTHKPTVQTADTYGHNNWTTEKEAHAHNMVLPQWGLTEAIDHLCYYQLLCIHSADGFQIPPLRQYPNR
jgi:DNA mismatch endonuclease Vsr